MSDLSALPAAIKRPTSLTVMSVLGIVFSSLGLLGAVGGCGGAICSGTLMQKAFSQIPAEANESFSGMFQTLQQLMQVLMIYLVIVCVVSLVVSAVGLVGSIGLVTDKRWSRSLSQAYAIILLVYNIIHTIVYSLVILPPYAKLMEEAATWAPSMNANPYNSAFMGPFQIFITVFGGIMGCIFPVLFIIFLNTPKAKAHFEKLRAPAA